MSSVMNRLIVPPKRRRLYIANTSLIIIVFSVAFYSRIITSLTPLPSALNHAHLILVPVAAWIIFSQARTKSQKQVELTWMLIGGLFILLTVIVASTVLNDAGIVNAIFLFLMLGEPFIMLAAIILVPFSVEQLNRYRNWIINSSFANMALAFLQWPLINAGILKANGMVAGDGMGGVFYISGAGNYVSATVSLYFGIYYLSAARDKPRWFRWTLLGIGFFQLLLSDSKQIILAFFLGWLFLILSKLKDIKQFLSYALTICVVALVFYWCVQNLEALSGFNNYASKQGAYGPEGVATQIKLAPFGMIPAYYTSGLNWLFGLGPGHTVGRLGGWLLKENWGLLGPLGATIHPLSAEMWKAVYGNWIALESTMFSPFFGWAGIWGDLGVVGLGAYVLLGGIILKKVCVSDLTQFLVFSIAAFGLIFTQMEEPGFMIYSASLLGLYWHENQIKSSS